MIDQLFVYGTLLPGDVRWPLLERYVVNDGFPDAVAGLLYDTGLDYPAAVFDVAATTLIQGRRYSLRHESIEDALHELDIEEDTVDGLYQRVEITTQSGTRCWAYAYGEGLELTLIPSGNWFDRPPRAGQHHDA
jgi:gamma-glutamylcyclotransferase (GGCT)/AIG2-like uncharacterized protein YtfP